jgi:hypothetical protein
MKMHITISYQLFNEDSPKTILIPEEEYYDPLGTDEQSYLKDGVAKHLDPHIYLSVDAKELKWLVLKEPTEKGYDYYRYQYFNGLNSFMCHSLTHDGTEEIIISVNVNEQWCHVTRTLKRPGSKWTTVLNSLVPYRVGDGSDPIFFHGSWSHEDLKGFGNVSYD